MKVAFKSSFTRDLKSVKDKDLKVDLKKLIESVEQVQSLHELPNLKKLKTGDHYFRIKLGDYRVGVWVEHDTVNFVRFLHRKDIYRYFP